VSSTALNPKHSFSRLDWICELTVSLNGLCLSFLADNKSCWYSYFDKIYSVDVRRIFKSTWLCTFLEVSPENPVMLLHKSFRNQLLNWKNSVDSNWNLNEVLVEQRPRLTNYSRKENMRGIFFWFEHDFGLLISPEICSNQHFFGVPNLWFVLFNREKRF
jgi:hypothetical protein